MDGWFLPRIFPVRTTRQHGVQASDRTHDDRKKHYCRIMPILTLIGEPLGKNSPPCLKSGKKAVQENMTSSVVCCRFFGSVADGMVSVPCLPETLQLIAGQ